MLLIQVRLILISGPRRQTIGEASAVVVAATVGWLLLLPMLAKLHCYCWSLNCCIGWR
jgi:hypothetical protein